jgi:hypothetical protein
MASPANGTQPNVAWIVAVDVLHQCIKFDLTRALPGAIRTDFDDCGTTPTVRVDKSRLA